MDSDSSSVSSNSEPENELSTYERIRKQINYISYRTRGYKVCRETKLAQALDDLARSPFMFFESRPGRAAIFKLLVKGEDAGTSFKPDVEVLQKHATPSSFVRGEETAIVPTYRNGTELKADELAFGLKEDWKFECRYGSFLGDIREELQTSMFVGKSVFLKFYKLAIYGEGGHFDWHRDSTHNDTHHGTVLVSLNTEWEGGNLMLRHQGVEIAVDMHPNAYSNEYDERIDDEFTDELQLVVVAFNTDTEHKVMPVTKGTRLVLQYDVEVEQTSDSESIPPRYNSLDVAVNLHEHNITSQITFPILDPRCCRLSWMKSECCKKKASVSSLSLSLTSTARQALRRNNSKELTRRFSMLSRIISTFSFIPFLYALWNMLTMIMKRSSSCTSINRMKNLPMQNNRDDAEFTKKFHSIFHGPLRLCSFHCQTGNTLVMRARVVRQGTTALACLWNQRARSDGVQGI